MIEKMAWLSFGPYGAGKTATWVSAFWDWKRKKQIRDGRWLLFGREENKALGVPEKLIRRFTSPSEDPQKFVGEFELYMKQAIRVAQKGVGPEVFVFDGFTEWNALFLASSPAEGFDKFRDAKDRFFQFMQFINPDELRAHVLGTARVDEKRKGVTSKRTGETMGADPEWLNFRNIPSMAGWARHNLGNYFGMVLYIEQDPGIVKVREAEREGVLHKLYFLPTEEINAYIKNCYEWAWQVSSHKAYLINPTFDDILAALEKAVAEAAAYIEEKDRADAPASTPLDKTPSSTL